MMPKIIDYSPMIGQRFGKLVVIKILGHRTRKDSDKIRSDMFLSAICDCGGYIEDMAIVFKNGRRTTCGCSRKKTECFAFNRIYSSYKKHAKDRGYNFELSKSEFKEITSHNCIYCDSIPSNICKDRGDIFVYSGIDRFNNLIGYEYTNCYPCCKQCNRAKSDLSYDEFIDWIERVYFIAKKNE